jgi:hypothetical protein
LRDKSTTLPEELIRGFMESKDISIEHSQNLLKFGCVFECITQSLETWECICYLCIGRNQLFEC